MTFVGCSVNIDVCLCRPSYNCFGDGEYFELFFRLMSLLIWEGHYATAQQYFYTPLAFDATQTQVSHDLLATKHGYGTFGHFV